MKYLKMTNIDVWLVLKYFLNYKLLLMKQHNLKNLLSFIRVCFGIHTKTWHMTSLNLAAA